MLEFLKELNIDEHDAIFFIPGPKKDSIQIEAATYKTPGEKIGGSQLGDAYHVILFREAEDGELINVDRFDAIFCDPLEYISGLIPQNWFGILAKKTTTSNTFVENTFDKLMKV
jgi:hypothetical protein